MSTPLTVYHNISCSKSNGVIEILTERNVPFTVRYYLNDPLTEGELRALLHKLNLPASAVVRRGEELAQRIAEHDEPDEEGWIRVLAENPVLLERPIVEQEARAIIARPPERVLELL